MNNDSNFIFEAYKQKTCLEYVNPDAKEMVRTNKEEKDREASRKRHYSGTGYRSNYGPQGDYPSSRSAHYADDEDAEECKCSYAQKGCDCNGCQECKDNQTKSEDNEGTKDDIMSRIEQKRKERKNIGSVRSEDAETYGVEGKIKAALQEIESFGYTGDRIYPMDVAKLVVGSPGDWGDSYTPLVQALAVVISNYYEKGLQDS